MNGQEFALFSLYLILFIAGTFLGGYLTKLMYRLSSAGIPVRGASFCPNCGKKIRWREQVPLFGYLFLRGRCRRCGEKISLLYPLTELFCGVVFCLCAFRFSFSLHALTAAGVICLYYALSIIDIKVMRLPDLLTGSIALLAVVDIPARPEISIWMRLVGMIPALLLWGIRILSKGGLGLGDVKLAAASGFYLGHPLSAVCMMLAILMGGVFAAILLKRRIKKLSFGPWLCLAYTLGMFFPTPLIAFWNQTSWFL